MIEITLEHETQIPEPAIVDVTATVFYDVDVWVVDFKTKVPQAEQAKLEARFIAEAKRQIAKHNQEFYLRQRLQDEEF